MNYNNKYLHIAQYQQRYPSKEIESGSNRLKAESDLDTESDLDAQSGAKVVQCLLCPHNCVLKEGQKGICRTRFNNNGKLYTMAWNNPCSICIDPIEKKPLYHFLPGTQILSLAIAGCNMRCLNCQNSSISQVSPDVLQSYTLTAQQVVDKAIECKTESIAYTYTEPTVYFEYMLEIAKLARQKGIKNVMVSNGYINREPLLELCKYLDAANIDLKTFDSDMHLKLTGAKLQPVLETLKILKKAEVWLEITHLIIPGYSDNLDVFKEMCQWLVNEGYSETPLHINRFFPQYKLNNSHPTPLSTIRDAQKIAQECGLKYIYVGNI